MKIVLWVCNEPIQRALANKIHARFPLAGIVTESPVYRRKISLPIIFERAWEKILLPSFSGAWTGAQQHFSDQYAEWPSVPMINVENINTGEALEFTKGLNPDLVFVSGTRLIRKPLINYKPPVGIVNLHTGLSPYIKGAPNCTFWCLATSQFHMIGNTVMWIDEGIDSGNLITTEHCSFTGNESLKEMLAKELEQGQDLSLRAIEHLAAGGRNNVPQDNLGKGTTYYSRQWGLSQSRALVKNFRRFKAEINNEKNKSLRASVKTVPLPGV